MSKGRARLAISQGLSIWVLEVPDGFGESPFHAHHAIQISVAFAGRLELTSGDRALAGPVIAVAADASHRIEIEGLLGLIFIEPESPLGRAMSAQLFAEGPLAAIDDPEFFADLAPLRLTFEAGMTQEDIFACARTALARLAAIEEFAAPDPRIGRIIDHAATDPDRPLAEIATAAGVHLSPSRLRHLFVEQTGLAFKTYLLWRRLIRALDAYSQGHSLTESAHAAGFADSAHFSRVFKRTFGLPATTLTRT
jgi:AraC family transcriptional regulator